MPYLQSPEWGWLILAAMFLSAVAAGAYFAYSTIELSGTRREHATALAYLGLIPLPLLLIVPLLLTLDLGQPFRFFNLLIRSPAATERSGPLMFNPMSPMDWGSWGLFLFGFFALIAFLDGGTHLWRWPFGFLERVAHNIVLGVIGGALSLLVGAYLGVLLSVTQQPVWSDSLFAGALYVTMEAFAGMGIAAIVASRVRARATAQAARTGLLYTGIATVVVLVLFVAQLAIAGAAAPLAFSARVGPVFWIGGVLLGLIVPLYLAWRGALDRLAIAGWLAILCVLALRYSVLFSASAALQG
jgi:formate-dependent nitrite reductase membrane component NrfD